MRIADKMNFEQVNTNLGRNRSELAGLQNQAATQKRVTKPSDDPVAATRVLAARTEIAGNDQYMKNITQARTLLDGADQSLGELSDALIRAKELALAQANDAAAGKDTRQVTAAEIDQLCQQAVQIGNRKIGDRFLFGGYKTTRAPFGANGEYHGDDGEIKVAVEKEATVAVNVPGSRIFLGRNIRGSLHTAKPPAEGEQAQEQMRGPASNPPGSIGSSAGEGGASPDLAESWNSKGVNIFRVLQDLSVSLRADDKEGIQESLDTLDEALAQVVLNRAEIGSKVSTLNSANESLQKGQVDTKALASNLEDVDTFELVGNLNKSESTLKATLETSGKLIQPSLLDFLK